MAEGGACPPSSNGFFYKLVRHTGESHMTYKPFGNSKFDALNAGDLARLAHIPEGWFVEYKREPCKPDRYAKEVSAFANAHGGYLFVGLEEDATTHLPSGGPGFRATKLLEWPTRYATQFLNI